MNESIPEDWIIKTVIDEEISGHSFEFVVTYTIYGHIIGVEPLFLMLPEPAQILLFGKKSKHIKKSTLIQAELVGYFASIATLFCEKGHHYRVFYEKAYERKIQLGLNPDKILKRNLSDEIKSFYYSEEKWNFESVIEPYEAVYTDINPLQDVLVLANWKKQYNALVLTIKGFQQYPNKPLLSRIYFLLLQMFDFEKNYHEIYSYAFSFWSPELEEFLSAKLFATALSDKALPFIIAGFHGPENAGTYACLTRFYKEKELEISKLPDTVYHKIMDALAIALLDYDTTFVNEMLWDLIVLERISFDASPLAIGSLRLFGIKEARIAAVLKAKFFYSNPPTFSDIWNSLFLFSYIQDDKLLPSQDYIFNAFEKFNESIIDLSFIERIQSVIKRVKNNSTYARIFSLLYSDDEAKVEIGVYLFPALGPQVIEEVIDFLKAANSKYYYNYFFSTFDTLFIGNYPTINKAFFTNRIAWLKAIESSVISFLISDNYAENKIGVERFLREILINVKRFNLLLELPYLPYLEALTHKYIAAGELNDLSVSLAAIGKGSGHDWLEYKNKIERLVSHT